MSHWGYVIESLTHESEAERRDRIRRHRRRAEASQDPSRSPRTSPDQAPEVTKVTRPRLASPAVRAPSTD